jgi:RNA polymerase sigma-70 factor (ECF subfamily)
MEALSQAELLRRIYPRLVAKTLAFTRNLPEAEDAVQEAILRALRSWPKTGTPDTPEAWLLTVAANAHRDRARRSKWEAFEQDALEELARLSPWVRAAVGEPEIVPGWKDELLRLVFACCHPALESGEAAALCLSTVVGLSPKEVALAFLVPPRTMEQRLTRARRRLRERGDPDGTSPERSAERIAAVLKVIQLLFNEGYWSSDDAQPIRAELCRLALGLSHSLAQAFTDEPEVLGLLALLLLHEARRPARLAADGTAVPLPEQDRGRWDQAAIAQGLSVLNRALALKRDGPLQLEAAISALHCQAEQAGDTDWQRIAALYAKLEQLRPTAAVRVNRAFAVARARSPEAGLALLSEETMTDYPYAHLVRGSLLAELGRRDEARADLERARGVARNDAERRQIAAKIAALEGTPGA